MKLPSLKLKTLPKQLPASQPLEIALRVVGKVAVDELSVDVNGARPLQQLDPIFVNELILFFLPSLTDVIDVNFLTEILTRHGVRQTQKKWRLSFPLPGMERLQN